MWKTLLNRSIREIRFVVKNEAPHHGVWKWIETRLPEIRVMNQNTNFFVQEIDNLYTFDSAVHIIYGDISLKMDEIVTDNLTCEQFEEILKQKIALGARLPRRHPKNNEDRDIPFDIVEARNTIRYFDDGF